MLKVKSIGWYLYTKNSVIFVYFFKTNSIFFQFFLAEKLAAVGLKKKFQSEQPEAATCQGAVGGHYSVDLKFFLTLARAMHALTVKKNSKFQG